MKIIKLKKILLRNPNWKFSRSTGVTLFGTIRDIPRFTGEPTNRFKSLVITLLLCSCNIISSSGSKKTEPLPGDSNTATKIESNYDSIRKVVIEKKCLSCHSTSSSSRAHEIPFDTEEQVMKGQIDDGPLIVAGQPLDSAFYKVMSPNPQVTGELKNMPPSDAVRDGKTSQVTSEELTAIENWIKNLPKDHRSTEQSPEPTQDDSTPKVIDYGSIQPIIDAKCIKCHKEGGKAHEIPFETKEQVLKGMIDEGPLVVPGHPLESAFFKVLNDDEGIRGKLKRMPSRKAVNQGQVQDITSDEVQIVKTWIETGAQ